MSEQFSRCEYCKKPYNSKADLIRHMRRAHSLYERCHNGTCNKPLEPSYPWITCRECLEKYTESKPGEHTVCPKCGNRGVSDCGHIDGPKDDLHWVEDLRCDYCDYCNWWPPPLPVEV